MTNSRIDLQCNERAKEILLATTTTIAAAATTTTAMGDDDWEGNERLANSKCKAKTRPRSLVFCCFVVIIVSLLAMLRYLADENNHQAMRAKRQENEPQESLASVAIQTDVSEKLQEIPEEYGRRHRIFQESLSTIRNHNSNSNSTWKMGINLFADRSPEDLPLGLDKRALYHRHGKNRASTPFQKQRKAPLPTHVDWREKGVTTPVKNQGHCGSCWAFASTAAMESHIAIQTGKLIELSVQELVTCAPNPDNCGGTGGCGGNTAELAYEFVSGGRGMVTEWQWGYTSGTDHVVPSCEISSDKNSTIPGAVASITGYIGLEHNDYDSLMEAVATVGPVVVNVDASNWRLYRGGIFDESIFSNSTTRDINHVVVVEGYGTEFVCDDDTTVMNSIDYWLVRNSWGPLWGEDGYIRLKRDSNAASTDCKPDTTPQDGIACVGPDHKVVPPVVDVCGTSGILYDALYPTGAHLLNHDQADGGVLEATSK